MDEIEKANGTRRGPGRNERVSYDMKALRAMQERFQKNLKAHEAEEERLIGARLRRRGAERMELEPVIERAYASLDGMTALLRSLSAICEGEQVYAVKTVASRLRQELEAHLAYEEKVLFPLLRRRLARVSARGAAGDAG